MAALLLTMGSAVGADDSKLGKESVLVSAKGPTHGKNKVCCGYPLAEDRGVRELH